MKNCCESIIKLPSDRHDLAKTAALRLLINRLNQQIRPTDRQAHPGRIGKLDLTKDELDLFGVSETHGTMFHPENLVAGGFCGCRLVVQIAGSLAF
jgi:hypothetical protein